MRALGRATLTWLNNIRADLGEIRLDDVDWIDLAQNRHQWRTFVRAVMKIRVQQTAWEILSSCTTRGLERRAFSWGQSII
jgi:hypothetical protein